jgi:hypothetical protein
MIARCVANRARAVPQYVGVLFFDLSVQFALTIGDPYPVLGMELYRDVLQILVPDNSDHKRPQWLPVDLFEIEKSEVPAIWYFQAYSSGAVAHERGFRARWGYRQLVESDMHRDGLEELDPAALAIFAEELQMFNGRVADLPQTPTQDRSSPNGCGARGLR